MPRTDAQVYVSLNGESVELAQGNLIEVQVDQTPDMPDSAEIVLADAPRWTAELNLGDSLTVDLSGAEGSRQTVFKGEVVGIEAIYKTNNRSEVIVRAFDRLHRLTRGRKSRTYEQVSDGDIVKKIAQEHGLGTDISSDVSIAYDHVHQHNQTDLEFLLLRAARIGYQVGVWDDKLYFKHRGQRTRPPQGTGGAPRLKWGETLQGFSVRLSSNGLPTKVTVRGWDPEHKREIVGEARRSDVSPEVQGVRAATEVSESAHSVEAQVHYVDIPVSSQAEAEAIARAKLDDLVLNYLTADVQTQGNPAISPGIEVEVSGVGSYDGRYKVADARHIFDRSGYRTTFKVGRGDPADTLLTGNFGRGPEQLRAGNPATLAIGIVTANNDPQGHGRVKVKLPGFGDNLESYWCRLASPMAGNGRGLYILPEVNDEVLVTALDWPNPIVLGSLWNGNDAPPLVNADAVSQQGVQQRMFKSRAGHVILMDDNDGAEKVVIQSHAGQKVFIDDARGQEKVVIEDKNGNSITLESQSNKLTIKASGNIEIQAGGNLDLKAGGQLNATANRINLN